MATYVLIHGAGTDSWYWHRVTPRLEALGHEVVAPDLPSDDDTKDFTDYADAVVEAVGDRQPVVVVGQSLGGFTAPLVAARIPTELLILVAAMLPRPGESAGEWFANTGWAEARARQLEADGRSPGDYDVIADLFHDVPEDITQAAMSRGERYQSDTPMGKPWPLEVWPDVPTAFLLCTKDRFFPAELMRSVVAERLGITADEIDSGHLSAFSRPDKLVERLEYHRSLMASRDPSHRRVSAS
jgi:pimeloyl-ACP methyl ester carboxylesterase